MHLLKVTKSVPLFWYGHDFIEFRPVPETIFYSFQGQNMHINHMIISSNDHTNDYNIMVIYQYTKSPQKDNLTVTTPWLFIIRFQNAWAIDIL